jgi:hypothetical protein
VRDLTPQEKVVQRALHWVAVGLLSLNLPLSTIRVLANPSAYKPWFAETALALLWTLLVYAVVQCIRQVSATVPMRGVLAVSCAALLGHPWLETAPLIAYPPLFHVLGAALCASAVGGVRFSAPLIPAFSAYVAVVRSPILGWRQAAAEACLLAVSAFIATGTVDVLNRAN